MNIANLITGKPKVISKVSNFNSFDTVVSAIKQVGSDVEDSILVQRVEKGRTLHFAYIGSPIRFELLVSRAVAERLVEAGYFYDIVIVSNDTD